MTQILPYVLEVGTQEVVLTPDPTHEFTATTEQVALGYGVSQENIRQHKLSKADELIEGKHWITVTSGVSNPNAGNLQRQQTLWTKRGIVRLGFFIRSARARLFRDMAEDLVIGQLATVTNSHAGPALISARGVAAGLGCSRTSAQNRISHARIKPTHHYLDPTKGQPGYLYPLDAVQSRWPAVSFRAFIGDARPGLAPVASAVTASAGGKIARRHQPRLLPTDTSTEQLARRLLSLEAQKKAVLRELAALA
ncbi:hypothetical protein [Deinococcus kurensis]|uniref:hypothetical protein n=1 Tax=Deinococcus kurensis TaxID=2662757 RepID=UPI0012D36690|nr:hypothetical protein [Deinococcus kurensis]